MFCPCGSKKNLETCCGRYLSEKENPPTPEALMRSRYTAFALGNLDYIEKTMKEKALQQFNRLEAENGLKNTTWIQLIVIQSSENESVGTVEFTAVFKQNAHTMKMHEISQFKKIHGKWFYISGTIKK